MDLVDFIKNLDLHFAVNLLAALGTLIILDTLLGTLYAAKKSELSSKAGRQGLINKGAEVLICITFDLLSHTTEYIPTFVVTGIYMYFIAFELLSILETTDKFGYAIGPLKTFVKNFIADNDLTNEQEAKELEHKPNKLEDMIDVNYDFTKPDHKQDKEV